jgi:gluconate 5-dehydrogenase
VRRRAEDHDIEAFRRIIEVNLVGAFTMTHAAASALLETGGCVVNVASVLGTMASPRLAGYGASKAGIIQLTRTLAREWADRGVRVNAVCPGYFETGLTEAMLAVEHLRQEIIAATPLGRLATMDEVVAPVLFLASAEASYITGAVLLVDGGTAA